MNYEDIKKLIDDMGESKLNSLDIEFPDGIKISMKKEENSGAKNKIVSEIQEKIVQNDNMEKIGNEEKNNDLTKIVKSPMVGTFYSSPAPDKPPFVKVGDKVSKGQVLCVVEAMKLMNEIESEYDGEIAEICINNEDMVEYGTPLFKLK